MNTTTTLLTDHPAWMVQPDGTTCRLLTSDAGAHYLTWDGTGLAARRLDGTAAPAPAAVIATSAADLPPRAPRGLTEALAGLGAVKRLPSPTLWEAITSGLLRRIIRAPQARALYQRWAATYGPAHDTPAGVLHAVPSPRAVLDLTEQQFAPGTGAAGHRTGPNSTPSPPTHSPGGFMPDPLLRPAKGRPVRPLGNRTPWRDGRPRSARRVADSASPRQPNAGSRRKLPRPRPGPRL